MLGTIWNTILVNPILNILVVLYNLFGGSLGWAIVVLTILIRGLLLPVVLPSLKNMQKQRDLQPELQKLQQKYKHDKQKLAEEQMKLFQKHGLNPASGCITQISMIVVLIALYRVIRLFAINFDLAAINDAIYFASQKFSEGFSVNTGFFYLDLSQPDKLYVLPILSGLTQLIASKMMQPFVEEGEKAAKKTPDKSDDLAYNMQEQMLYLMPLMTAIIAFSLPSGVALYILTTTIFSIVQQYFVSGWGGMKSWFKKIPALSKKLS